MRVRWPILLGGGLGLALAACGAMSGDAPAAPSPPRTLPAPEGRCLFLNAIEDWRAVDAYHIRVRTKATGWQYEIELTQRCSDILWAEVIVWGGRSNQLCDYRSDFVAVRDSQCFVGAIRALEEDAEAGESGDR